MALPTVFQMFGGKPKLQVEFSRTDVEDTTLLRCRIWNQPIKKRLLRLMGVIREHTEISAHLSVEKYGSGELIKPLIRPHISTLKEQGEQVTLFAHSIPAIIPIASITDNGAHLIMPNGYERLPAGAYIIKINITMTHQMRKRTNRVLVIGDKRETCYWRTEA